MRKRNRKTGKISLKKIKVTKLNNLITIKGGGGTGTTGPRSRIPV